MSKSPTPEKKVKEYLREFSLEKSIDIAETMVAVSELMDGDTKYWLRVLQILKVKKLKNDTNNT